MEDIEANKSLAIDLTVAKMPMKSIKERLIDRFKEARQVIGPKWRKQLREYDPFFDTYDGATAITKAANSVTKPEVVNADRLERVVLAMEEIADIKKPLVA